MRSEVYWIDQPLSGRLAIMARPRAGDWLDDEIARWRAEGIDIVVSLLEREEVNELGLQGEEDLCRKSGMTFVSFPIRDRDTPGSFRDTATLARLISSRLDEGLAIAIHCRAGIGRSSLVAACALICLGTDAAAAFDRIGHARGVGVPDTEAQRAWVGAFQQVIIDGT
jgi:protein-tyrosine phosphatase